MDGPRGVIARDAADDSRTDARDDWAVEKPRVAVEDNRRLEVTRGHSFCSPCSLETSMSS